MNQIIALINLSPASHRTAKMRRLGINLAFFYKFYRTKFTKNLLMLWRSIQFYVDYACSILGQKTSRCSGNADLESI